MLLSSSPNIGEVAATQTEEFDKALVKADKISD